MYFDFELLLVVLTVVTGVIWVWDKWLIRKQQNNTTSVGDQSSVSGAPAASVSIPWWIDLSRSLFPVILAVLIIRSFLAEPFRIPSGSMIPTLFDGDFILVNKYTYGLRLPVAHLKLVNVAEPKRGDVVVFRYPVNPSENYIKRLIGLPGDHIEYHDKHLYINGELMDQLLLGRYTGPEQEADALLKREQLGNVAHQIVLHRGSGPYDFEYDVPAGNYFMMGDNRDRSSDSRFWGTVPERNLVGKAFLIWMSFNKENFGINWNRIGDGIN